MIQLKFPVLNKNAKISSNQKINILPKIQKNNDAPFLTSASRQNITKIIKPSLPGPGQYNISKPLVKPLIETMKKSNNSIIIKINQTGSPAFKGNEQRFKSISNEMSPGPGQYIKNSSFEKFLHYKKGNGKNSLIQYKQKFKQMFNNKKNETIILPTLNGSIKNVIEQDNMMIIHQNSRKKKTKIKERQKKIVDEQIELIKNSYIKKSNKQYNNKNLKSFVTQDIEQFFQKNRQKNNNSIVQKPSHQFIPYRQIKSKQIIQNNKFLFFNSNQKRLIQQTHYNKIPQKINQSQQTITKFKKLQQSKNYYKQQDQQNVNILVSYSANQTKNKTLKY